MGGGDRSRRRDQRHAKGLRADDGAASAVRLERVDGTNRKAVLELELAEGQSEFVADNASSLRESKNDKDAQPRAIVADNRVVGFLMYDANKNHSEALIYRFMIDRREQGRGYGRAALVALLDEVRDLKHIRDVVVLYMPENEGARRLYRSAGFVDEELDDDGEMVARLSLSKGSRHR